MKCKIMNFKRKYSEMSPPVKASFWFTVSNVLQKGIALLSTPIMTRILTQEQYGTFSIYQSWLSIVVIFATLNIFQSAYTKGLIQYDNDREKFTSSLLGLTSTITIITFLIFLLFADFWSNIFSLSPFLIGIMFIEIFFMSATQFWSANERVNYRYKKLVAVSIGSCVGGLIIAIIAVLLEDVYKAEVRIIVEVLSKCIVGVFIYLYIFKNGKKFFHKKYWKYALAFNVPLIPHFLSHYVLNQSDRVMIDSMAGKEEAAIYSVAYSISMMMFIVITAINNSFVPYVFQKIKDKCYTEIYKHSNSLILLVAVLCILSMCFAPEIIAIFADKSYSDAVWIVPPVATSVFFIFIYSMYSNVEYYYKKTTGISIASFVAAALNIVLNVVFIKKFGYIAAGYTTLVSYICLSVMHFIFYKRIVKKEQENQQTFDNKTVLLFSVMMIVVMLVMLLLYNITIVRYCVILILLIICVINRKDIFTLIKSKK